MSDADFETGDVFETPDGPIQITDVSRYDEHVKVTDPTEVHPQNARYGEWVFHRDSLRDGLQSGEIERATLEVV